MADATSAEGGEASSLPLTNSTGATTSDAVPDRAHVYIYRLREFTLQGRASTFYVDEAKLATMLYKGCVSFELTPGIHKISERWLAIPWLEGDLNNEISVVANLAPSGTYYFRLSADEQPGLWTTKVEWRLEAVTADEGELEIRQVHCGSASPEMEAQHRR